MSLQNALKSYYHDHSVPNPINVTLTEKQVVGGQWIDDESSAANVRHFRNLMNTHLFKNAYKRHGKQLSMLVVREADATHRHHLHLTIEIPDGLSAPMFMLLIKRFWSKTRFGYGECHYEQPANSERELGWINYSLKMRSKSDLVSSVDWENSTCFERR